MKLALAILFAFSLRAEVIQLGTICRGTGIDIVYPDRSDIVSLEITFLKPGAGMTNLSTITTTNRLLQLSDIPAELPDGRTILAMRWICLGGVKSAYRLATMDLYRNPPDAPIARPTFVSVVDGASGAATGVLRSPAYDAPVGQGQGIDTPTILSIYVPDGKGKHLRPATSNEVERIIQDWRDRGWITNDAPIRAWHGAITDHSVGSNTMVDPDLARAVAEQFRKPTDPPPPLPPATNGMQRAYEETPAQRAQRMFFEQGGQKGDRPTIIPGRIIWK